MRKILPATLIILNKNAFILLIALLLSVPAISQNVSINSTGAAPNSSAGLDVDFPNKGLLIPRIALTGTAGFTPLAAHVAGMIVYNTATVSDVIPGFYYDDGSKWVAGFPSGLALGNMLYWNGTNWVLVPTGLPGQYLQLSGTSIPIWGGIIAANPAITTTAATLITATSASSGANITSDGGSPIFSRGVCWNTVTGPTIGNSKTTDGSGIGIYTSNLTGLLPGTTYFVRAYAVNATANNYGNEISFITLPVIPTLATTTTATAITTTTAISGGNVTNTGGSPILERGILLNTAGSPTLITPNTIKIIDGGTPGLGLYISNLTGLIPGTHNYYAVSYATNSVGTGYGAAMPFSTPLLVTSTTAASSISGTLAASGGVLAAFGTAGFAWKYGTAYSLTSNAVSPSYADAGTYPGIAGLTYVTNLTGLTPNKLYYIRAYAETTYGVFSYGPELSFTTVAPTAPIVASTNAVTSVTATTATSGGVITTDGGSPLTHKGVCWGTSTNPLIGTGNFTDDIATYPGSISFVSSITGLTGSTTYYVRAYATNAINTSYGPVTASFTTWVQSSHYIGELFGVGTVAYLAPDGSGLIISPDILPTAPATYFNWGCDGTMTGTGTALGTGKANTDLVILACGATTPAGSAKAYTGGGFNDWYLPSLDELGAIALSANYFGFNSNVNYFTSSELNIPANPIAVNSTYAYTYFISNTGFGRNVALRTGTTTATAIRAIRSFGAPVLPTVFTTDPASAITGTTATSGGNVSSDGGSPVSIRGVCWSTTTGPTIAANMGITNDGAGIGTFVSNLTGLTSGLTYFVRAYATNSIGTSYGPEMTFTAGVASLLPVVTTDPMGNLVGSVAEGNYNVINENGVVSAAGLCFSTNANPTLLTSSTVIIPDPFWAPGNGGLGISWPLDMTGLTVGTTYHVRAYATNGPGSTGYGADITFTAIAATLGQLTYLNFQNGIVYSVTGGGAHGLIALNFNSGQPADWGCTNTVTTATGTIVGAGLANTNKILANILANTCVSAAPAGQFAAQMSLAGADWYLPSKDEFALLWTTVNSDQTLYSGLTFGLTLAPFWSSTEVSATDAWYFDGTAWQSTGLKTAQYNVWPIRSF